MRKVKTKLKIRSTDHFGGGRKPNPKPRTGCRERMLGFSESLWRYYAHRENTESCCIYLNRGSGFLTFCVFLIIFIFYFIFKVNITSHWSNKVKKNGTFLIQREVEQVQSYLRVSANNNFLYIISSFMKLFSKLYRSIVVFLIHLFRNFLWNKIYYKIWEFLINYNLFLLRKKYKYKYCNVKLPDRMNQ